MGEWELFAMGLLRPTDLLGLPLVGSEIVEVYRPKNIQIFLDRDGLLIEDASGKARSLKQIWFSDITISKNRNGSSTLCVFKTHYLDCGATVAKYRIFMKIQVSDHTRFGFRTLRGLSRARGDVAKTLVFATPV